jgi:hypothetical protein
MKTPVTMTVLLLAASVGLQAQTSASSSSQQTEEQRRREQSLYNSPSSQSSANQPSSSYSQSQSTTEQDKDKKNKDQHSKDQQSKSRYSINEPSTSSQSSSSTELKYSSNQPSETQNQSQSSTSNQASTGSTSSQTSTAQTGIESSTQTNVALSGVDTEVRTVVQQIDAQGPVVVERISTEFAEVACTEENARALVEALHGGTSVTLRGDGGATATFTPTTRLGYGEAYIAMSLAVEALRQAGITGCATPAQWQAVLLGGELSGGTVRTSSVTTERFPGILVLREQGGWAKVAQTTNVQLNQVVSRANTNLQINNTSSTASTNSTSSQQNLSPVGRPSNYDPRADANKSDKDKADKDKADKSKGNKDHDIHNSQKPDEAKSPDMETPPKKY